MLGIQKDSWPERRVAAGKTPCGWLRYRRSEATLPAVCMCFDDPSAAQFGRGKALVL
jgi:hypothetical protein